MIRSGPWLRNLSRAPIRIWCKPSPRKQASRGVTVKDGTAAIDFDRNLVDLHPGGSASEIMTLYSLTNTVILNVPSVKKVTILIEGKILETIKGHIDTSSPLELNRDLIVENK